jgi:hypothetical protein
MCYVLLLLLLLPPAHAGACASSSLRHTLKLSAVYLTAIPLAISTANTAKCPLLSVQPFLCGALSTVGAKLTVNLQIL